MMENDGFRYSYGPVPSRRLGKSLGINNIPAKACSYACVYCQVGPTTRMQTDRQFFYEPGEIFMDVWRRVNQARAVSERIDYLAFVPDGEPTLDARLGESIAALKSLGIPIAVITNSSLIWRFDVRAALAQADWVSLKVDTVQEKIWRRINRPHKTLRLSAILDGMCEFAENFTGRLVTETMLVSGVNESEESAEELAVFLNRLQPHTAYLSIPTRPPAEAWVRCPDEEILNRTYQILSAAVNRVECLSGYEGNAFAFTDNVEQDLLSITAVHPMRKDAVSALLLRADAGWEVVNRLVSRGDLVQTQYREHLFYLRKFPQKNDADT